MTFEDYEDLQEKLRVFYSPIEASKWMRLPHPRLDYRRPIDCRRHEVEAVIDKLDSEAFL